MQERGETLTKQRTATADDTSGKGEEGSLSSRQQELMTIHAKEGERLTGQPTAIAGDTLRVIMDMGKFQGVIAATTPTGCFMTTGRLVADTVCRTSPLTLLHSSANHSMEATLQAAH